MNVEHLSHYWERLPSDSPQKDRYAPPEVAEARYLPVVGVVLLGVLVAASGGVLAGLFVLAAGLVWGAVMNRDVVAAAASRAHWNRQLICLACPRLFTR